MVDVMLVLLIIFMVITPMLTKGQSVDMVKTKNPIAMQAADKEDAVLIAVTRDGKVYLSPGNHADHGRADLPAKVKDLLTQQDWTRPATSRPMRGRATKRWRTWSIISALPAWTRSVCSPNKTKRRSPAPGRQALAHPRIGV